MSHRHCLAWSCLVAAGLLSLTAPAFSGPVTYVSQARSINSHLREVFEGDPDNRIELSDDHSAEAPDFGVFDATVTSVIDPIPPDQPSRSGRVTGTHRSSLGDGGISVSGRFTGNTGTDEGGYGLHTLVGVTFDLPEPRAFTLTYFVERFPQSGGFTTIALGTPDDGRSVVGLDLVFDEFPLEDTLTGTLAPGRYRFQFEHAVGGDVGVHHPYSVELALAATTPTPVPLPQGAQAALAATGLLLLLRGLRTACTVAPAGTSRRLQGQPSYSCVNWNA
jgi:hypothetical protein